MEVGTSSVLVLPHTASSVGVARRRLISDLADAGVFEGTARDAGLVLSELISNALRHATPLVGSTVKVAWQLRDDRIEVAVSDGGGPTVPAVSEPGQSAIGGRGLSIVQRLSHRWGVYPQPGGGGEMIVWAELALDGAGQDRVGALRSDGTAPGSGATDVHLADESSTGLVTAFMYE